MSNLVAVDVQSTDQGTEVVGVLEALDLSDLRCEGDGRLVTSHDRVTLSRTLRSTTRKVFVESSTGNQVRHVDGKAIDHADLAVTENRAGVAHELSLSQIGLHEDLTLGRGDDEPAVGLRHVGLVQHARQGSDALKDVGSSQSDRRSVRTKVVATGDLTGSRALVGGSALVEGALERIGVDSDLHLHSSVVRKDIHQLGLGLELKHVVDVHAEVLALIDRQADGRRSRNLIGEVLTDAVVVDGDRGDGVDNHRVTHVRDVALPIGVGDLTKNSSGVELLSQLARPEGGDEGTRVGGTSISLGARGGVKSCYCWTTRGINWVGCACGDGRHATSFL